MTEGPIIHERRKFNEEIEHTFISVAIHVRNIMTYCQTERSASVIDLYEKFYADFSYLVIITGDLDQLSTSSAEVSRASKWLESKPVDKMTDDAIMRRCIDGVKIFMSYKKVLSSQGVISLPGR